LAGPRRSSSDDDGTTTSNYRQRGPLLAAARCGRQHPLCPRERRIFEWVTARSQHRERCDLYHAALEVRLGADRFVIEMAPVWSTDAPDRGTVCEGPVGLSWLGRSRFFPLRGPVLARRDHPRYHRGRRQSPSLSGDPERAEHILALAPSFPTATWGRDELGTGDMWNSNSLIAWLLARSGHDMDSVGPPEHGRAPGWAAGIVVAGRSMQHVAA
jgi:hypothetical protein